MANKKITELPDIGTPASGDLLEIVDISEGVSKRVAVSALGSGSTPTLQEVLDEGKTATFTDANEVLTQIYLGEYEEDNLRSSIYFIQSRTFEDIEQITLFIQELGLFNLQTYFYDLLTNIGKVGSISSTNGDISISKQDSFESFTKQQSITFEDVTTEPAGDLDIVYKPNPKTVSGSYYLATLDDIPTIDATPTDGSANAVSSNGVFDALALKANLSIVQKIIFSKWNGTFGTPHTGDTLETVVLSLNVSGGTFEVGDNMSFLFQFLKTAVSGGTITWRVRAGTTGATSDDLISTMIQASGSTAVDASMTRERFEHKTGDILEGSRAITNTPTDNVSNGLSKTSVTIDPTSDWKLTITAQLQASSDTARVTGYIVRKTKSQ